MDRRLISIRRERIGDVDVTVEESLMLLLRPLFMVNQKVVDVLCLMAKYYCQNY